MDHTEHAISSILLTMIVTFHHWCSCSDWRNQNSWSLCHAVHLPPALSNYSTQHTLPCVYFKGFRCRTEYSFVMRAVVLIVAVRPIFQLASYCKSFRLYTASLLYSELHSVLYYFSHFHHTAHKKETIFVILLQNS